MSNRIGINNRTFVCFSLVFITGLFLLEHYHRNQIKNANHQELWVIIISFWKLFLLLLNWCIRFRTKSSVMVLKSCLFYLLIYIFFLNALFCIPKVIRFKKINFVGNLTRMILWYLKNISAAKKTAKKLKNFDFRKVEDFDWL